MSPEVEQLFRFCDLYQPTFYIFFSSDFAELCPTTRFTTFSTPFLGFTSSLPSSPTAESACRQPAVQSFAWLCYFVTLLLDFVTTEGALAVVSVKSVSIIYALHCKANAMVCIQMFCFTLLWFDLLCFTLLASFFSIVGIFSCFGCEIHKHRGAHCFEVLMCYA